MRKSEMLSRTRTYRGERADVRTEQAKTSEREEEKSSIISPKKKGTAVRAECDGSRPHAVIMSLYSPFLLILSLFLPYL